METRSNLLSGDKKPYYKPRLRQVRLRPEEAVLGNCKAAGVSGPNVGGGTTCALPTACSAPGS